MKRPGGAQHSSETAQNREQEEKEVEISPNGRAPARDGRTNLGWPRNNEEDYKEPPTSSRTDLAGAAARDLGKGPELFRAGWKSPN